MSLSNMFFPYYSMCFVRPVNRLKFLERVESNKLYKNQQKLETTTADLKYSKER